MKQSLSRYITGLLVLALGVGALLDVLNVIPFWSWLGTWWPLILIVVALTLFVSDFRRNYIWALALVIIGVFIQLRNLDMIDFSVTELIFPVILIAIGLTIVLRVSNRNSVKLGTNDADDISAILSGSESKNKSQKYKGGKVTSIFGGAVLDLRDAKIDKEATLDLFVLCGGVEIKVPRDWKVIVRTANIAGGIEDKSEGAANDKGSVLIVTGTIALGGVEIKT